MGNDPNSVPQEASIVIACHTERRWGALMRAIASARAQRGARAEVIVAVDHNPSLCARLREAVEGIEVVHNDGIPGASATRDAGATRATTPVLVFLDDDVSARPDWLAQLIAPLHDPTVIGTGGRTVPAWQRPRPHWFPDEFGWVIGASYAGLPSRAAPVRNVWSENMAVRRDAFEDVGGFRLGFGKLGRTSRPEDTDLCIRIGAAQPGRSWLYVPRAVVEHEVPPERTTLRFFLKRCYWEGAGKVELSAFLKEDSDLGAERTYLLRTLPLAIAGYLRRGELSRAAAIAAGTLAAAAGGAVSLVRGVIRGSPGR